MPQWLKIVLVLLGMGVLGLGACVGGVVWWVGANKDRILEGGKVARDEGTAFGRGHAKGECVDEALTHLKACGPVDFVCETLVKIRMSSCLSVASGALACGDVPKRTDILKAAMWVNDECKRRGQAGSQPCGRLMQGVIDACTEAGP